MQAGLQSGMQSVPCEFVFRGLPRADVDRLCALTRGVDKEVAAADARVKSRLQQVQAQAAEAARVAASGRAAEAARAQAAANKAAAATREVDAYRGLPAYMQGITARMQAVTGALSAAAAALERRSVPVQAPPLSQAPPPFQAAPPFQAPPPSQNQGWAKYSQGKVPFPAAESNVENMLKRRQNPAVRTTSELQQTQEAISQRPNGDDLRTVTENVLRSGVATPGSVLIINRELEGQQRRMQEAASRPVSMDALRKCYQNTDEGQRKECILNVLKAVAEMDAPPDDNTVLAVKGVLSTMTPHDEEAKGLLQTVLAASGQEFQQALKELVGALSTETMDVDQDPVGDLFKLSVGNTVDEQRGSVPIDGQKKTHNSGGSVDVSPVAPYNPPVPEAPPSIFATDAELWPLQQEIVDYARATEDFAPDRNAEGTSRNVALELENNYVWKQEVFNNPLLEKEIDGLKDADANGKAKMVNDIVNALDGKLLSRHLGNLIRYLTGTQGDQAVRDAQRSLLNASVEELRNLANAVTVDHETLIGKLSEVKGLVDQGIQMSIPVEPAKVARSIFDKEAELSPEERQIVNFTFAAVMAANDTDTHSAKWDLYKDYFKTNDVVRGMLTEEEKKAVDDGTLSDVQKADIFKRISVAIYFAPFTKYLMNLEAMVPNTISRPDVLTSLDMVKALQGQAKPGLSWDGLVAAAQAQPFNGDTFRVQLQALQAQALAQQEALRARMGALDTPRAPEAPIQPVVYTPPNVPGDAPDTTKDYAEAAHFFYQGVTEAVLGNRGALMQFLREHTVDSAALSRLMPDLYQQLNEGVTKQDYGGVEETVRRVRKQLNGGDLIAFIDALIYYVNPATTTAGERVGGVRALVKAVDGVGLTPELQAFATGAAVPPERVIQLLQQWRRNKTRDGMPPRHGQEAIQKNAKEYMDAYVLAAEALADMRDDKDDYDYFRFLEYRKNMFQDNAVFKQVKDAMPPDFQGVLSDKQYVGDRASLYKSVVMNLQERVWKAPLEAYLTQLIAYVGSTHAPATLQDAIKSVRDATAGAPILYTIDRAMKREQVTGNDLKEAIEGVRNVVRAPQWMLSNDRELREQQRRHKSSIPVQPREPVQWTGMFSLNGPGTQEGKQARDYAVAAEFFLGADPATKWDLFSKQLTEWRRTHPTNTVVNENLKSNDQTDVNEFIQKLKGSLLVDFLNNLAKWASRHFDAQKAADVQAALRMARLDTPEIAPLFEAQVTPEGLQAFQTQVVDTLTSYAAQLHPALQAAKSVPVDDGTAERLSFVTNFGVAAWILFTSNYSPADKLSELRRNVEGRTKFVQMMPLLESLGSAEDKVLVLQNIMQGALLAEYYENAIPLADSSTNAQGELLASLQNLKDVPVVPDALKQMVQRQNVDMAALKTVLEEAKRNAPDDDPLEFF